MPKHVRPAITALALLLTAGRCLAAEHIVFYDADYSVQYGGNPLPALAFFTAHGFRHLDTPQLLRWIDSAVGDGTCAGTTVLHLSDITPKKLVEPWDTSSPIYRFCATGGRWVAPGGNTLYAFEGESDFTITKQGAYTPAKERFLTAMFGVGSVYGLRGKGRQLTDLGKTWGLDVDTSRWLVRLLQGVPPDGVTPLAISEDRAAALLWLKNVNPEHPHSGLLGLCVSLSDQKSLLDMLYRVCCFSGTPVTSVPAVNWQPKAPTPEYGLRLTARVGGIPRRAFQRGEEIPLTIEAFGTQYRGQAVQITVNADGTAAWEHTIEEGDRLRLKRTVNIPTERLRCQAYEFTAAIRDRATLSETFHICPSRRNTLLPWYVCKMHRKNVKREEVALNYVRDHNLNTMIFDLYQLENAAESPAVGKRLGHYLDLLLRLNLNTSARPTAIALATENPDETIIRYDGNPLKHGAHNALSWRAFREQHLDAYRASLRRQVATLRGTRSPVLQPWFTTNDDGSMGGNFDFNDLTMARLKADTGLTRDQLPPLKKMPAGNSVFMPDVAPGILPDNHPWLRYFRWHGGHYAVISNAAMEGLQSGWPGCYVQDTGCMAGPLYVPRAYYPPIAFTPLNTAGFYQYLFWFHAYPFAIEAARMGNRDKPVGAVLSASWIDWGGTFQRGTIYRTLAEAPAFLGFWSLDARRHERWEREEESWTEMQRIGEKLKLLAPYVNRQRPRQRHGALFFGLAQNCFNLADKHLRPFEMRSALENFQRAGYKLDLVSTEEAMAGALASYRAVFVAGHEWLTEGAKSELEAFAEHGGALLIDTGTTVPLQGAAQVDGPFGTGLSDVADPICVERCRSAATRALAEEEAAPISPDTIIRVNQLGTGLIAWIIDVETPAELRALQKAQSDDWNSGTHRLLEGWTAETPSVKKKIRVKTPYWAYDLYSGRALPMADDDGSGWREASVDVDAFGASPVALLRDRIAGLEASAATQRVRRGDSAVATFTLTAASGAAIRDPVPATVGVFGPDGNEAWEYGGPTVIDNGLLRVQLPTAVNDAHGQWRTTVRELCSGKTATAQVTVTE